MDVGVESVGGNTLVIVYGTRPEFIKLAPLARGLATRNVPFRVVCTGQHTDLLAGMPEEPAMAGSSLGLASTGDIEAWVEQAVGALRIAFDSGDRAVLVQGDTMSALAGARAAAQSGLPLAHLEAGVRSHNADEPWPEEEIRTQIDFLASLLLAPTEHAARNLHTEGRDTSAKIVVTGNTVVSALDQYAALRTCRPAANWLLVTMHRREWYKQASAVRDVAAALDTLAAANPNVGFVWPVHPAVRPLLGTFEHLANFRIESPSGYLGFLSWLASARAVVTDSGGVVEEAVTLGVPVGILRRANDRPEPVEAGRAIQDAPTGGGAFRCAERLLRGEVPRSSGSGIFGTPSSAANAAEAIMAWLREFG